jgi:anaerobic selenocysteine-containing dehydrogenase
MSLNTLIGNYDWIGGNAVGGGGWSVLGDKPGQVNIKSVSSGLSPKGIRIDRSKGAKYESTYLFTRDGGYPAKRPWFPIGSQGNYQEVIPSALEKYPYPLKVLITYWNAWPYSTPALKKVWEDTLRDETRIPLYVAIETHIGEASSWADYILPETTYLEKWSFPGMTPTILTKATPLRQPLVGSFDGKPWNAPFDPGAPNNYDPVLPDTRMLEDILIDLAKRLDLPGVGANAFDDGGSLNNTWDFIKKELQNLSVETGKSVNEIIAKGGAFEDLGNSYSGDYLKYTYGNIIHLYIETLVRTKDSINGQTYDPLPKYEPVKDAGDQPIDDSSYPFQLVTYKPVIHAQARTAALPWLMLIRPENFVEINTSDARGLGVETGDLVKVTSLSNSQGIIGKAKVTEGIRPGVVAIAHSYGHWELGSRPREENGVEQDYDPSRGAGIQPNVVMRLDPYVGNVTLQDKVGGSASFYDTRVSIEKVIL